MPALVSVWLLPFMSMNGPHSSRRRHHHVLWTMSGIVNVEWHCTDLGGVLLIFRSACGLSSVETSPARRAVQGERPAIVPLSWHADAQLLLQEVSCVSERQWMWPRCSELFKHAILFYRSSKSIPSLCLEIKQESGDSADKHLMAPYLLTCQ